MRYPSFYMGVKVRGSPYGLGRKSRGSRNVLPDKNAKKFRDGESNQRGSSLGKKIEA